MQDVPFPVGKSGNPDGVACAKHLSLAVRPCPLDDFKVVADKVNNNTQFKNMFFEAERLLAAPDEARVIPAIVPPTSVETTTANRSLLPIDLLHFDFYFYVYDLCHVLFWPVSLEVLINDQ